ncbi:MAG TPA: glycosyltransferase family 1 protein [Gemmatimonadaceae bacterium]|nr:glycosyltransferase family 1 protein [Gemmatimonadaceae bacterium]
MVRKLTLGISGWRLHGQRTGIARYLLSIIEQLTPEIVQDRFASITVYTPRSLASSQIQLPAGVRERVLRSRLPLLPWENFRLGPAAGDDVVFYPAYSRALAARGATVVTTHDATMKVVPTMFDRRARYLYAPLYGWSARAATVVLTTSEAARRDIVAAWNVEGEKIRVTPLAAATSFAPLGDSADRGELRATMLGEDVPYFLIVGKATGRRNIPELMRGFLAFKRQTTLPHRLLVTGPDYSIELARRTADEIGVGDDVMTRPYVRDDELNVLYNCAEAFITPSVYENGSLPVFEAQAAGTPVISVDTDGTREVTGGAALFMSALTAHEVANALSTIAGDLELRRDLSLRGLANSRQYSWERCARETLDACYDAAQMHRS